MRVRNILIVAILISALIVAGYTYHTAGVSIVEARPCRSEVSLPLSTYENAISRELAEAISVLVSERADSVVSVDLLRDMGLRNIATFKSIKALPHTEGPALLILHIDDLVSDVEPAEALEALIESYGGLDRLVIMVLNPEKNEEKFIEAFHVILKFHGYHGIVPILPIEPYYAEDKREASTIDHRLASADAVVFSINPVGLVVVESPVDQAWTVLTILKWTGLINKLDEPLAELIGASSGEKYSDAVYIGYIGWITANWTGAACGETTGVVAVRVNYYYSNVTTPRGVTYHAWFAHVEHSAVGYKTFCCVTKCFLFWCWEECNTYNHYPYMFNTTTDWRTTTWPGQVLDNWQPRNAGAAAIVSFTVAWYMGATVGKDVSLTVEYSTSTTISQPATPYFEWWDHSRPWEGIARTIHYVKVPQGLSEDELNNVLFTVEPTSVGYLDPEKLGGYMPMVVRHEFITVNNHGDSAAISFWVQLWDTHVRKW